MKIINHFLFKIKHWLEKNSAFFAKFENRRRFKKWDTAPSQFGINSHTTPFVYRMLLSFKGLTDFELKSILLLFRFERFTPISKNEYEDWLLSLNQRLHFMDENFARIHQETLELAKTNEQKYLATVNSFLLFTEVFAKRKISRKENGEDQIRNIKKLFCELRVLLNQHIAEPEQK